MATLTLLSLLCLATVMARADARIEMCAGGPAYWCQSLSTATACRAIQHCLNTAWAPRTKPSQAPHSEKGICELCKKIAQQVLTLAQSKDVQQRLTNILHKLCSLVPVPLWAKQCNSYVDGLLPLAFQFLNKMKPDELCKMLYLCKSNSKQDNQPHLASSPQDISLLLSNKIPTQPQAQAHAVCVYLAVELDHFLSKNETQLALLEGLSKLCSQLPETLSAQCEEIMKEHAKSGLERIVSLVTPQAVCSALHSYLLLDNSSGEMGQEYFPNDIL